jgi:hypothetical protein
MGSAISQLLESLHRLQVWFPHPLALVTVAALLAALIEQRMVRRRTADNSGAWRGIDGPPPKLPPRIPPPRDLRDR